MGLSLRKSRFYIFQAGINMEEKAKSYGEALSKLIQKETVSASNYSGPEKFHAFHAVLKECFPLLFGVCEAEDFNGSLMLRWQGSNAKDKPPVMFMNHHDVVEADGTDWLYPPFSGTIAGGKVWGRGTLDTKGGLWAMMQAAEELISEGFTPTRDIYFVSTCTEETTGEGALSIVQALTDRHIHFEAVFDEGGMILYDPIGGAKGTFAMIGVGEKSCCDLRFIARSKGGHAAVPGKNTPLVRLGKFMAEVDGSAPFKKKINPVVAEMMRRIAPYMGRSALF